MPSMEQRPQGRQALPDPARGVVVGIDVSKRWIDFGVYRLGARGGRTGWARMRSALVN